MPKIKINHDLGYDDMAMKLAAERRRRFKATRDPNVIQS